jgi:branched-chain amino acid transport system permease protein
MSRNRLFTNRRRDWLGLLGLALFMGTLPLWLRSSYALSTLILIGILTIVTIGLCLLMGYAGQISLGHGAFYGLGAYGSAILTTRLGWSPWLAVPAAAGITALAALLFGLPTFRLRGHYLAMGTLALGFIVELVLNEWKAYTGGPTGLPGIPRFTIAGEPLRTDRVYFYLVWACALVALLLGLNLVNSRWGRALRAIRASEQAAQSLGIDVARFKLLAFIVSAVYASVAGSLYAHYMIFVSPTAFDFSVSVRLVLMVVVGGLASIWGAPLGTALVLLLTLALREIMPALIGKASGELEIIAYGALLVIIMLFMPDGLTATLTRTWRRSERARSRALAQLRARVAGRG